MHKIPLAPGRVPNGKAVLKAYDELDHDNLEAVQRYNALAYAYLWRDDIEHFRPDRIVIRVPVCPGGPIGLVVINDFGDRVVDPNERQRIWQEARRRGEV